jgi:lysophospholipase L1-like esterase
MNQDWMFDVFVPFPLVCGLALYLFVRYCQKSKTPAGWGRLLLGNTLVFIFLVSVAFLTGEAYYRFFCDTTDSLTYTKASQDWLRHYYRLNSAGFRDNIEYALAIEPGKRRVTFVGDSFTAGYGVKSVEDRFPNIIRRNHPEWEIHVLADMGYDTGDELEVMGKSLNEGYQADLVVLVYNLNDVSDILPEWKQALQQIAPEIKHRGWLQRNSYFVDTMYHRWKVAVSHDPYMKNYFDFVRNGYQGPVWESQKQRLIAFRNLVRSHGGRLLEVTFPFLHATGPNYQFQSAHDELNRFWTDLEVPHLDLLPVYKDLPPSKITVNRYDAHPNEQAHALAAEKIDQFLKEEMNTNSAPSPAKNLSPLRTDTPLK